MDGKEQKDHNRSHIQSLFELQIQILSKIAQPHWPQDQLRDTTGTLGQKISLGGTNETKISLPQG